MESLSRYHGHKGKKCLLTTYTVWPGYSTGGTHHEQKNKSHYTDCPAQNQGAFNTLVLGTLFNKSIHFLPRDLANSRSRQYGSCNVYIVSLAHLCGDSNINSEATAVFCYAIELVSPCNLTVSTATVMSRQPPRWSENPTANSGTQRIHKIWH